METLEKLDSPETENLGPIMVAINPDGTREYNWDEIEAEAAKFTPGETDHPITVLLAYLLKPFNPENVETN